MEIMREDDWYISNVYVMSLNLSEICCSISNHRPSLNLRDPFSAESSSGCKVLGPSIEEPNRLVDQWISSV